MGSVAKSQPRPLERLTVAARPLFESLVTDAADTAALIQVSGMTLLPDGSVVVGDNGASKVRWYSGAGKLIRSFGREGDGPGEFRLVNLIGSCGTDSLFVYDGANQRLTTLSLDGKLIGTRLFFSDSTARETPSAIVCGRNRTFGVLGWPRGSVPSAPVAYRTTVGVRLVGIATPSFVDIGTAPSSERQRFGNSAGPRPLGKRTSIAVGSDRLYVATGDSSFIRVHSTKGAPLRGVELPLQRYPIRKSNIEEYLRELVARNPRLAPADIRRAYGELEYPEFFPAHGEIFVDRDDRLWVEEHRWPGEDKSRWIVVDRTGQPEAEVSFPPRFRAVEASRSYVLGTWADDDGVLHVRMYRLVRP
jgi:hypothetical protein